MGMKQIDPAILNSIGVSFPEQRIDIRLRNVNVTGARWTKLVSRRFSIVFLYVFNFMKSMDF